MRRGPVASPALAVPVRRLAKPMPGSGSTLPVGTAGESSLRRALLGSTAYRLLNSSTRPGLVVPPG
jgi:hypothetical protein